MIKQIGQIMLFVNDPKEAKRFWTEKAGFVVVAEEVFGEVCWIEIKPSPDAQTSFIIQEKRHIAKAEPDFNVGTPSVIFYADDVMELHRSLREKGVTIGEIVQLRIGRTFYFADHEGSEFTVIENKA